MRLFISLIFFFFQMNVFSQQKIDGKWKFIGYYNFNTDTFYYRPLIFTYKYRNFEIEFFSNKNSFKGRTSFNRIYGNYELIDNNKIKVTHVGGTRVGRALDMLSFETALRNSYKYEITDDTLRLYSIVNSSDLHWELRTKQIKDPVYINLSST